MKPKKNIFVTSRAIQGKMYLINKHEAYLLDSVEQFIWENIDGENTIEDIIQKVAKKYNEDPNNIEQDLKEFFESLKEHNLIRY